MTIEDNQFNVPIPSHYDLTQMVDKLKRGGRVANSQFDQIYPLSVRCWTSPHWTPVDVAIRAAELLVTDSNTRVLDVGSGVGKFCLIGALTTSATFCGIEQRPSFVRLARTLASVHSISRVSFLQGDLVSIDWSEFNDFYLFNPFYENILSTIRMEADTVDFSEERYDLCVKTVQDKLSAAPDRTRVVTYHGMGGQIPEGYVLAERTFRGTGPLELWIKQTCRGEGMR